MRTLQVEAIMVDDHHVKYKCPYCFTKYKKNGQPRMNAKHVLHQHGSNSIKKIGHVFTRGTHCRDSEGPSSVDIRITQSTKIN